MFRPGKLWLFLAALAVLTGCQPVDSFNPLYTDKDAVFDPALLGKWIENGGTLEFVQSANDAYVLTFMDDSNPPQQMTLEGHLLALQGHRFLDLIQTTWTSKPNSFQLSIEQAKKALKLNPPLIPAGDGAYIEFAPGSTSGKVTPVSMHLRVAHWFFRVNSDDKNLTLDYIDDDRLSKLLEQGTVQIGHNLIGPEKKDAKEDDRQLVLTAPTAELQKFVLDHVNDDQVFAGSIKFHRAEKPATPSQ